MEKNIPNNYNEEALVQIENGCMSGIIIIAFVIIITLSLLIYIKYGKL